MALDTHTKKINPLSIILGGGVHGKACWLIAYRFLVINKLYSASQMFVPREILSFDELLRKSIYRFVERIENSTNSIIHACLSSTVFLYSAIRKW